MKSIDIERAKAASLVFREPTDEADRQRIGVALAKAIGLCLTPPSPPPPRVRRGRTSLGT